MLARRVPHFVLTTFISLAAWSQTNTAAGAGTYPAQPQPNSTANLGVRPEVLPWDTGEAGLHLLAKKLKNTGRIMHLTAHPDDEDGALLTYLSRGQGRQVLLMSLTRGEGGQNRTGSNLWDELGVLRTLELLESTRYYGTELRFSRVADFGFSKSADETFQKWGGHQVPLRDIVYVIREWKPDVLFTRFSGTPRDGHGMHQASAILAPEAVKCAADPNCFPDQLKGDHALTTWQVLKLYMGNQGGDYTVRYDVSQIDPDTKLSYTQMALEGFKHQASQLSGNFTPPSGPNWRSYKLISTTIPNYKADKEQDFFDGIDTSIRGLVDRSRAAGETKEVLKKTLTALDACIQSLLDKQSHSSSCEKEGLTFVENSQQLNLPDQGCPLLRAAADFIYGYLYLFDYQRNLQAKVTLGKGIYVTPHSRTPLQITLKNLSLKETQVRDIRLRPFEGGSDSDRDQKIPLSPATAIPVGGERVLTSQIQVPATAPLTKPHWHRKDPEQTVYTVDSARSATLPFVISTPTLEVQLNEYLYTLLPQSADRTKAARLLVAPAISVLFDHVTNVATKSSSQISASLEVRSSVERPLSGSVSISAPRGWTVLPPNRQIQLSPDNPVAHVTFTITPATRSIGRFELMARVEAEGKSFSDGFSLVARQDLDTFPSYQPAIQRVSIVDVNVPKNLRIGYIPGAGDDIFPVLQQLGLNAKQISNDELAKGDLHQYDTIVVGIRGYDERPEIRANNQRLLDFVNDGGTLLVQNQKAEDVFNSGKFTPYPATLGRERVSVEEAPVTVLAPNDSVFNSPNKITQADFDGWVQERGINFMSNWDPKFEPLLSCNDPGEQPLKGGLLRAKYGKGTYIYTGYAFFRQLPAGVPGAVRLYVNLLNAGHETK